MSRSLAANNLDSSDCRVLAVFKKCGSFAPRNGVKIGWCPKPVLLFRSYIAIIQSLGIGRCSLQPLPRKRMLPAEPGTLVCCLLGLAPFSWALGTQNWNRSEDPWANFLAWLIKRQILVLREPAFLVLDLGPGNGAWQCVSSGLPSITY